MRLDGEEEWAEHGTLRHAEVALRERGPLPHTGCEIWVEIRGHTESEIMARVRGHSGSEIGVGVRGHTGRDIWTIIIMGLKSVSASENVIGDPINKYKKILNYSCERIGVVVRGHTEREI